MFQDGYAGIDCCPRCEHPTILAHEYGLRWRLSTLSVPLRDALVVVRYFRIVMNVWIVPPAPGHKPKLRAVAWYGPKRPERGRLYVEHLCKVRK